VNEDNYKEQFESLATGLEMEKLYDKLADRAEFVRVLTMHCGEIYRTARRAGLPRKTAEAMAREYFDFETTPSSVYVVDGGEG
jgi:hypothetical protein